MASPGITELCSPRESWLSMLDTPELDSAARAAGLDLATATDGELSALVAKRLGEMAELAITELPQSFGIAVARLARNSDVWQAKLPACAALAQTLQSLAPYWRGGTMLPGGEEEQMSGVLSAPIAVAPRVGRVLATRLEKQHGVRTVGDFLRLVGAPGNPLLTTPRLTQRTIDAVEGWTLEECGAESLDQILPSVGGAVEPPGEPSEPEPEPGEATQPDTPPTPEPPSQPRFRACIHCGQPGSLPVRSVDVATGEESEGVECFACRAASRLRGEEARPEPKPEPKPEPVQAVSEPELEPVQAESEPEPVCSVCGGSVALFEFRAVSLFGKGEQPRYTCADCAPNPQAGKPVEPQPEPEPEPEPGPGPEPEPDVLSDTLTVEQLSELIEALSDEREWICLGCGSRFEGLPQPDAAFHLLRIHCPACKGYCAPFASSLLRALLDDGPSHPGLADEVECFLEALHERTGKAQNRHKRAQQALSGRAESDHVNTHPVATEGVSEAPVASGRQDRLVVLVDILPGRLGELGNGGLTTLDSLAFEVGAGVSSEKVARRAVDVVRDRARLVLVDSRSPFAAEFVRLVTPHADTLLRGAR